ncbi:SDR family oxidoreductase [Streptomyces sp. NPDC020192]|uniref:SDR family oxidoreductase n=1 Tax=Streptomyces sp. NPDC020192 TaxID=3365066 RepID=UPI0037B2A58D
MILVTGASGHVGGELVDQFVERGRPVRAHVRDLRKTAPRHGVEVVEGDLNSPETLTEVLADVDGVFLLGGFEDMAGVLSQAKAAGMGHVVVLSSRSVVAGRPDNAVVAMHLNSEAAVGGSGLGWTVLRPSGFMSNTSGWRSQLRSGDIVRAPFAGVPIAAIDPHGIAAVCRARNEDRSGDV